MSELSRILDHLRLEGVEVEDVEDGALVKTGEARVALFAEAASEGGVLVRLHLDLDLYVEETAMTDVLMGVNMMNQSLDYGSLVLDPVSDEDDEDEDDSEISFAVLGRSVLWLHDLGAGELERLREHLGRFEAELSGAIERAMHGGQGISA